MFLRRLVIKGFKSFADRTVFEFTPGVAVIVGPNGSGKSNIVDAIAWVLGEQGAKSLRGGRMEDVIFAGTGKRPGLGRAEVELTIDNSSGVLPIEFTEVTIRRTLFRSGDSGYAINGAPCRLLDIQELLSDSGIGRELHTIIGQGQLDDILAGRPEDRRAVIEEAAGLLKHRKRKERAVRKLDRVDADVERLGDVISELRRQIRPLERQADIAKKAGALQEELADLHLKLWVVDYTQTTGEGDAGAEARAQGEVEQLARELAEVTERAEALEVELTSASQSSERMVATEYRLAALRDRFTALARLAEERGEHLRDLVTREPRGEAPSQTEMAEAESALHEASALLQGAITDAAEAESERAAMRSARDEAARAREEIVHLHGERAALRAAVANAEEERRTLATRRAAMAEQEERARAATEEIRAELARLDEDETALSERVGDAETKRDAGRGVLDRMRAKERDAEREVETLRARLALVEEQIAERPDPAASLEGATGIAGRVSDHVEATAGYERAVRAALGAVADGLVGLSHLDAVAAIERLKHAGGRASIALAIDRNDAPLPSGLRAVASVARERGPHGPSIMALLSSVALADSIAEAASIAQEHGVVVVTTDGDRIDAMSVTGGSPDVERDPIEERRVLLASLDEASDTLDSLRRDAEHVEAEIAILEAEISQLDDGLHDLDATAAGATERLARQERDAHAAAREDDLLAGRAAELDERLKADQDRLQAVEAQLSRSVASEPELDGDEIATIERRAADRSLRLGEARERERAAQATLEALKERARRIGEDRARWEAGRAEWEAEAARAVETAREASEAAEQVEAWVTEARQLRAGGDEARAATQRELEATRARRRELTPMLDRARERAHQVDLRRAERMHRIDALVERLRDEHDLSPTDALEAVRVDDIDVEAIRRAANGIERRLALLGRVNPIAMEQYGEMVERHRFLTEQVEDLRKSRRDLMGVVDEVDQKIVEIFGAAFAEIAAEFGRVFARLFPGGDGRLVLTDPDDLLNSGIEVEARPPGKRVKRVSLLSGGERSLVSIALLFSVFRARPSPFYLLDEVEAALDDVNLHRFLGIAREFRETSQLLIVTHQKRTMEIADALYGISMGEQGVTSVICEKLGDLEPASGSRVIELP